MSSAVLEGGPLVPYHRASGHLLFYVRKYFLGGILAAYFLLQKIFQKKFKKNAKKVLTNTRKPCIIKP